MLSLGVKPNELPVGFAGCWQTVHAPPSRRQINITPGPHLSGQTGKAPCLNRTLARIFLVIVYNYPHFDSIPLLTALYRPAFPHLLFCGPPGNTSPHRVLEVDTVRGILGYECLAQAIREHPGYQGYFYINDDVILNYWNFIDFDTRQIWESPSSFGSIGMYEPPSPKGWYWWVSPYGLQNCQKAFEELANMNHVLQSRGFDIVNAMSTLYLNGNTSLRCYSGRSDVLYIPARHAKGFSLLAAEFYKHRVFLEIAIPTILRMLDLKKNLGRMDGYYIPGDVRKGDPRVTDSRHFWSFYFLKSKLWFIHPFKLHHAPLDNRLNTILLRYFLTEKGKDVTMRCVDHPQ